MSVVSPPRPVTVSVLGFEIERDALKTVLTAFLGSRLIVLFIILFSMTMIPVQAGEFLHASPDNVIIDGLVRHDSWWYHNIVTQGYDAGDLAAGRQGNVAFFPLYPLLVKLVSGLTGDVYFSGILVSHLGFLGALFFLHALARRELGESGAGRAVFYFATAPTAVFFSAMYTESLYMLCVIATFYYAGEKEWTRAALWGMLASATRNTGVLMAAVIALEGLHHSGWRFWPPGQRQPLIDHYKTLLPAVWRSRSAIAAAAAVPMGIISYMAYLANTFGDPLAFIHVQANWGRNVSAGGVFKIIGSTIQDLNIGPNPLIGQFNAVHAYDLLLTLVFAWLLFFVMRQMRPSMVIFSLLTFLVPLMTGTVASMSRYILMLIPCFLLLARWGERPLVHQVITTISLPLFAYSTILFSHWYFAG